MADLVSNWARKARVGDVAGKMPTSLYNDLIDAARKLRASTFDGARPIPSDDLFGDTGARIQNNSGGDLDAFSVVKLGNPFIDDTDDLESFQTKPNFSGTTPDATDNLFAILAEPIPDGEIGRGVIAGISPVQINVTDSSHAFATPTAGDATQMTSGTSGSARILWKQSGTGTKWALVALMGGVSLSGSGITIAEADGSPSYSDVASLTVDQDDGFVLTQPGGAGTARLDMAAATASQAGIVSTTPQTFGGMKRFNDEVGIEADPVANVPLYVAKGPGGFDYGVFTAGNLEAWGLFTLDQAAGSGHSSVSISTYADPPVLEFGFGGTLTALGVIPAVDGSGNPVLGIDNLTSGGSHNASFAVLRGGGAGTWQTGIDGTSGGGDTVKGGIITALGSGGAPTGPAGGSLSGTYPNPTLGTAVVGFGNIKDELLPSGTAAPSDEALRALGTSGDEACAGNDSRLSDTRTPTDASVTTAKLAATIDLN